MLLNGRKIARDGCIRGAELLGSINKAVGLDNGDVGLNGFQEVHDLIIAKNEII